MSKSPVLNDPLLQAIAIALDVPVAALFTKATADEGRDLAALLRAWAAIEDVQGQRRVLTFAQREAERAGNPALAA